jgi:hypothetical protein
LQADIFAMLTLLYFVLATESHEEHSESTTKHSEKSKEGTHA